jgi:phosphoribosylanthranilate isomerase
MTRIKICGITNLEDARAAGEAGVDAIGLNFYPRSPRALSIEIAGNLRASIPSSVQVFGVFVDAEVDEVAKYSAMCVSMRCNYMAMNLPPRLPSWLG